MWLWRSQEHPLLYCRSSSWALPLQQDTFLSTTCGEAHNRQRFFGHPTFVLSRKPHLHMRTESPRPPAPTSPRNSPFSRLAMVRPRDAFPPSGSPLPTPIPMHCPRALPAVPSAAARPAPGARPRLGRSASRAEPVPPPLPSRSSVWLPQGTQAGGPDAVSTSKSPETGRRGRMRRTERREGT